ncbi:hypothetical protein HMPREF3198_00967 [Winkia neuii]|nr:hypothetical protein HMPREF3198_00967 [Winkia neuii]
MLSVVFIPNAEGVLSASSLARPVWKWVHINTAAPFTPFEPRSANGRN